MIKLIVFDLDGTLAKIGKGITDKDIVLLKELENMGVRIAICSGKPTYYLCGFMRQIGLKNPILVGENGAVIQFGVELPPKEYYVLPYSDDAKKSIFLLRNEFEKLLPNLWYQPNLIALTPFPSTQDEFTIISNAITKMQDVTNDIVVYRHVDSFDIVPKGIDKLSGLMYLGNLIGISRQETVAVGDGINDYPMFEYACHSVGVNATDSEKVHKNFSTTTNALEYLIELVSNPYFSSEC